MYDEDLECSPDLVTTDRAEAINATAIKHEGIKNDISQFQIKVTKIPNASEAMSYDFENKVRTSVNVHNISKIGNKDKCPTRNYIYKTKISKLDFKRLSLKDSREFKKALGLQQQNKSELDSHRAGAILNPNEMAHSSLNPSYNLISDTHRGRQSGDDVLVETNR